VDALFCKYKVCQSNNFYVVCFIGRALGTYLHMDALQQPPFLLFYVASKLATSGCVTLDHLTTSSQPLDLLQGAHPLSGQPTPTPWPPAVCHGRPHAHQPTHPHTHTCPSTSSTSPNRVLFVRPFYSSAPCLSHARPFARARRTHTSPPQVSVLHTRGGITRTASRSLPPLIGMARGRRP
jgi:hypothetical protein